MKYSDADIELPGRCTELYERFPAKPRIVPPPAAPARTPASKAPRTPKEPRPAWMGPNRIRRPATEPAAAPKPAPLNVDAIGAAVLAELGISASQWRAMTTRPYPRSPDLVDLRRKVAKAMYRPVAATGQRLTMVQIKGFLKTTSHSIISTWIHSKDEPT